jgi:hypothetical protein
MPKIITKQMFSMFNATFEVIIIRYLGYTDK